MSRAYAEEPPVVGNRKRDPGWGSGCQRWYVDAGVGRQKQAPGPIFGAARNGRGARELQPEELMLNRKRASVKRFPPRRIGYRRTYRTRMDLHGTLIRRDVDPSRECHPRPLRHRPTFLTVSGLPSGAARQFQTRAAARPLDRHEDGMLFVGEADLAASRHRQSGDGLGGIERAPVAGRIDPLENHKCGRGWIRQCQDDECSNQDPDQSAEPRRAIPRGQTTRPRLMRSPPVWSRTRA